MFSSAAMAGLRSNSSSWKLDSSITTLSPGPTSSSRSSSGVPMLPPTWTVKPAACEHQPDQRRRGRLARRAGDADDGRRTVVQGEQPVVAQRDAAAHRFLYDGDRRRDAAAEAEQIGVVQQVGRMPAQREAQRAGRLVLRDVVFAVIARAAASCTSPRMSLRVTWAPCRQEETRRGRALARQPQDDHVQAGVGRLAAQRQSGQRTRWGAEGCYTLAPTTTHAPGHSAWNRSVSVRAHAAASRAPPPSIR